MNRKILFIHRRDLRLIDNTALNEARKTGAPVLPCFIFDPRQVGDQSYRSSNAIQFMTQSLKELAEDYGRRDGKLYLFYGETEDVIQTLIHEEGITDIFFNKDYTPFSCARDAHITAIGKENGVGVFGFDDVCLTAPGAVLKDDGKAYEIFTSFYKKALAISINKPASLEVGEWVTGEVESVYGGNVTDFVPGHNPQILLRGGRNEGLALIRDLEDIIQYERDRDFPYKKETSHLSAYHKFGTVSIRETYWGAKEKMPRAESFIRQLYWRDFYTHLAYHFPHVFSGAFHKKYAKVRWEHNDVAFGRWKEGKTGFPIVDAGMRELRETGYMHNRVRMIVASFLVKDLHIHWQYGERYFATQLTDYDPCVNNGSWQWAASTGADAAPYFRIFNPWTQQKRFDPEALYIKKWLPELADVSAEIIHKGEKKRISPAYAEPMVVHKEEAEEAKRRFSQLKKG